MDKIIKVAVLGCTGYTGIELVNILDNHPNVILSFLGSQSHSGEYITLFDERLRNVLIWRNDNHPNIEGNKFMSEKIYNKLLDDNIIDIGVDKWLF